MTLVVPTWTVDESKGGIKTYLTGLVGALQRAPGVRLHLLCTTRSLPIFAALHDPGRTTITSVLLPGPETLRPVLEQAAGAQIGRNHGDVLVVPSNVGLLLARIPQIVVVQAPLAVPTIRARHSDLVRTDLAHRAYHRAALGLTLKRACAVVTVSAWLRCELLESIPRLDPRRLHVVAEGVVRPPPAAVRRSVGSGNRILFVSTLFPYKGAAELVAALRLLARDHPQLPWECRIVGRDPSGGRTTAQLEEQIRFFSLTDRVTLVGPIPHDMIWREYRGADLFVYPSRLETFGLPPLEAMAVGVPVIASVAPSVAEVVGDAAQIVDPADAAALARAMAEVLGSTDRRAALVAKGHRRAATLSWEATAERFVAIARAIMADRRRGS